MSVIQGVKTSASSDSMPPSRDFDEDEKKGASGDVRDAEADSNAQQAEERRSLKAEKVELTPAEALKWDVGGDQSPCELGWRAHYTLEEVRALADILCGNSSRSCGLCE